MAKQHGRRTTDSNDLSASFAKHSDWTGAEDGSLSDNPQHSEVLGMVWSLYFILFFFPQIDENEGLIGEEKEKVRILKS